MRQPQEPDKFKQIFSILLHRVYWTEIVRIMSTQKLVRSKAANALGEIVEMDICTQPTQAAAAIYDKIGFRHYPIPKNENL